MTYYENECNIVKQRVEELPTVGKIHVLTILCPNCQGKKMIGTNHQYECQSCNHDGTIDVVRYSTYMKQLLNK